MSYMRIYQLPVMQAFREIKETKPLRLWGPRVKPRAGARTAQRAVAARMGARFARALATAGPR